MPKPTKRLKKKPRKVAKPTTVQRALDSRGQQLKVGQRVRFDDALYNVEKVFTVPHPDGPKHGKQEVALFRSVDHPEVMSQIHLPLVTIFDDGAATPKAKKKATPPAARSFRARLRSRRR